MREWNWRQKSKIIARKPLLVPKPWMQTAVLLRGLLIFYTLKNGSDYFATEYATEQPLRSQWLEAIRRHRNDVTERTYLYGITGEANQHAHCPSLDYRHDDHRNHHHHRNYQKNAIVITLLAWPSPIITTKHTMFPHSSPTSLSSPTPHLHQIKHHQWHSRDV